VVTVSAVVAGVTAMLALDVLVLSAVLVAVTVTLAVAVTVGAVNRPALEILPALADQVTAVLLVPCTVAPNCCLPPELRLAVVGDTATVIPEFKVGGTTVMVAVAFLLGFATLVAVMVTFVLLLTLGALNNPELEMVPALVDQVNAEVDSVP